MIPRALPSLQRRLGMALALVALLAQFWMGQMATGHLAQTLVAPLGAGDVCSAPGSLASALLGQPADPQEHQALDAALHCPACVVAAAQAALLGSSVATAQPLPDAATRFSYQPALPRALRHASLYPPAQAPPGA